jgi:hypothetical protein
LSRQSSSRVLAVVEQCPILAVDHKMRDLERQMSQKERIMCNHYLPPILLRGMLISEASFKMYYIHAELDLLCRPITYYLLVS